VVCIAPPGRQRLIVVVVLAVLVVVVGVTLAPAAVDSLTSDSAGDSQRKAKACANPYGPRSPWNAPIGSNPIVHPNSAGFVRAISDNELPLSSDPDQYTPALFLFNKRTPRQRVELSGWFSTYDSGDNSRMGHGYGSRQRVPVPAAVRAPSGSDSQVILWDPKRGIEYGFWQFGRDSDGTIHATNGYRYHTTSRYRGRFADGLAGRGAGLPYLAGLVRPCELAQGRIRHALAFAYDSPAGSFVYPASKSDGVGDSSVDVPEGTRLQLNPALDDGDFRAWRLGRAARTIARALQRYGMYVVDNSGSSKIFLEARTSAHWPRRIGRDLVSRIPWREFRVVGRPARTR
jgi:hypothetical protein